MENSVQLLPRDKILRDTFTPAETLLFVIILITASIVNWFGDPRSFWLLGSLIIFGCLTPVILKTHEQTHPFFIDLLWPKFWICSMPAWIFSLQFIIGLTQNPLGKLAIGELIYNTILPVNIWRPSSSADSSTWVTIFGFVAIYLLTSTLYIVPKSRSYFERLLPWLCFGAVLVGVTGLIQKGLGLTKPLLTSGTGANDFFAYFPYDGHWAAFATLWCCACIAMALLSTRYDDSPPFIQSIGPWYLTGGLLLGASGLLVEALLPSAILLLTLSVMLLLVAVDFLANSKDMHRKSIALFSGLAACFSFAGGIVRVFQDNAFSADAIILRSAAYNMFKANPIFGWGIDSYGKLLPFFSSDMLLGQRSERATSDLLQFLAEFGIFGALILLGFLVVLTLRHILRPHNARLTNHLLIGCGSVLILALCDSPFMSPAVYFSFFTIFFISQRWADLSRAKIDEVDARRPQLITPETERRVPFFNEQYKEKEK
ncbi:MAG: O-antigen ligase family protein [Verrucomicrobiota bacterium]|nr:O-antigen ligase family protein [Verrucomicrobiota bacterium]